MYLYVYIIIQSKIQIGKVFHFPILTKLNIGNFFHMNDDIFYTKKNIVYIYCVPISKNAVQSLETKCGKNCIRFNNVVYTKSRYIYLI